MKLSHWQRITEVVKEATKSQKREGAPGKNPTSFNQHLFGKRFGFLRRNQFRNQF
jgi:hypothetical protein